MSNESVIMDIFKTCTAPDLAKFAVTMKAEKQYMMAGVLAKVAMFKLGAALSATSVGSDDYVNVGQMASTALGEIAGVLTDPRVKALEEAITEAHASVLENMYGGSTEFIANLSVALPGTPEDMERLSARCGSRNGPTPARNPGFATQAMAFIGPTSSQDDLLAFLDNLDPSQMPEC